MRKRFRDWLEFNAYGPCEPEPRLLERQEGPTCSREKWVIQTEPGNVTGPTNQGLDARWAADTDRRSNICYSEYRGNGARVVNVPIITPIGNGRSQVTVTGLAAFFLRAQPAGNGDVVAEFIHEVVPGTGGGGCNGTVFTIRLIE